MGHKYGVVGKDLAALNTTQLEVLRDQKVRGGVVRVAGIRLQARGLDVHRVHPNTR